MVFHFHLHSHAHLIDNSIQFQICFNPLQQIYIFLFSILFLLLSLMLLLFPFHEVFLALLALLIFLTFSTLLSVFYFLHAFFLLLKPLVFLSLLLQSFFIRLIFFYFLLLSKVFLLLLKQKYSLISLFYLFYFSIFLIFFQLWLLHFAHLLAQVHLISSLQSSWIYRSHLCTIVKSLYHLGFSTFDKYLKEYLPIHFQQKVQFSNFLQDNQEYYCFHLKQQCDGQYFRIHLLPHNWHLFTIIILHNQDLNHPLQSPA